VSTKSDLLQVPADLILNLRREALRDYLTACEDANRAGEEMLANADRPPSEQAPAIDLAAELVRHRAHVDDAEHALEMVGDDLQTVEAWQIDVTAHRGGAGLIADVIDRAIDRQDDTITESSHADPDEIDAARERITRLHTLLSDLERRR
jgi:hypothetical protein